MSDRSVPTPASRGNHRFAALPGAELVSRGIEDLREDRDTEEALLVSIGAPRLRSLGIEVPPGLPSPEHALYLRLAGRLDEGAHSAYNALVGRLVSFEHSAASLTSQHLDLA